MAQVKVRYMAHGKEVFPGEAVDAFEKMCMSMCKDAIIDDLEYVKCPDHGNAEVEVVCEAKSIDELTSAVNESAVDLLILDWEFSKDSGSEVLSKLRERQPDLKVIAISGRRSTRTLALDAGSDEFVCKCDSGQRLLEAIAQCSEPTTELGQGVSQ